MPLSSDDIIRIAALSRLHLSDQEAQTVQRELDAIFELIAAMQAVDTEGIEPMAHAQETVQRLREDQVSEPNLRALFQSIAPETENGLYLVPKVIE